jgi:nitroreductase
MLIEKPSDLPTTQINGEPLKSFSSIMLDRRATRGFTSEPVPEEYLSAILRLGTQAPSGYNFQPWRFIVVQEEEQRKRLQAAAFNQPKVSEAPVVIIAVGMKREWKETAREVMEEGKRFGAGSGDVDAVISGAFAFLDHQPMEMWVNRHTMIAFTSMMLAAEAFGLDTAPMEGFDAAKVKEAFDIPEEGEVVALLAIGRAKSPDKAYPGRFPLERIVYRERFGAPFDK